MKKLIHIFVFILSFGMLVSPAMAYVTNSFEQGTMKGSCCMESNSTTEAQHSEEGEHCPHDQNDCCGNNCPNKDCCLHLNVYQPLTIQFLRIEMDVFNFENTLIEQNDFYKFFHFKELIYSVWQPPKILS